MSIQAHRETLAANRGAMLAHDAKFFASVEQRYDALKAKGSSAHPADYGRLKAEVGKFAQTFANKDGKWSDTDQRIFDGAMAMCDILDAEADNLKAAGVALGIQAQHTGWFDANTGKPVRVLAPNEPLFDGVRNASDPRLGDLLQAIVQGPRNDTIKNALAEGTDSAGGYSVPTFILPEFIDKLRAKTQFINAGARTLILDGKTRIMRIASDPAPAWRAENAAVTESEPTFDAVDFAPKSLAVLVKASVEVLADSVNVGAALEKALVGALAVGLDSACLFGDGTGNSPVGLFSTAGINTVSMGVNGATPSSYDDMLDALYDLEVANSDPPTAAIMHPRTARTYRKLKDTLNNPLRMPAALQNLPFLTTTSVPINQTQGTAAGVCSTMLMGDFDEAILGLRQQLMITKLNERFMDNLQVGFIAHLRADVGFAHPESFTAITGIKP